MRVLGDEALSCQPVCCIRKLLQRVTGYIGIAPDGNAYSYETIGPAEKFRVLNAGASGRVWLQSLETELFLQCLNNGGPCKGTARSTDVGTSFVLQTSGNTVQLLAEVGGWAGFQLTYFTRVLTLTGGGVDATFTYVCQ